MASVSASHLFIFVASLVIAAGVVGTLTTGVERVSSSIDDGSLDVSQQIRMDMSVISDSGHMYDSGSNITIHVRNTGSQQVAIERSSVDLVLNGQFLSENQYSVRDANGDDTVWRPGGVIEIEIAVEGEDANGVELDEQDDNRLFLTVNGDEELFEFRTA